MENERTICNGSLKGVYENQPGSDIHILFKYEYDMYDFSIQYSKSKVGKDDYTVNIAKVEDLILSTKGALMEKIYLPRHFQEVAIDMNIAKCESVSYFAINGILAINNDRIISYIQDGSPALMKSNFTQLMTACEMDDDKLPEYLDELRGLNCDIDTVLVNQSASGHANALNELCEISMEEYLINKYKLDIKRDEALNDTPSLNKPSSLENFEIL